MTRKDACLALAAIAAGCAGSRAPDSNGTSAPASASGRDLLAAVKARGTLSISTDADYKPQSYRDADGTWEGFDVDVGREIARRLGVKAQFHDVSFDLITAGHWNGRFDLNVNSMGVTPERRKALLFTQPYYYIPASFVVHAQSRAQRSADLAGKRVGVGRATTYQSYLEGKLALVGGSILTPPPAATTVLYDTDALALQDLALGDGVRLDAVLTALPTAQATIAGGAPLRILGEPVYREVAAIDIDRAAPEDPAPLLAAVEGIVAAMHHDGTLTKLSKKYYGVDLSVRH